MAPPHTKPCAMFHERFPFVAHAYEVPILRKLTICFMLLLLLNLFLTGLYFYMHWDLRLLVTNGFLLIILCFELLLTYEVIFSLDIHFDFADLKERMWPLTEAGPEVYRQIQDDIRFLRRSRALVTLLLLLSGLICVPISGDLRELLSLAYLIEDFEQWSLYRYFAVLLLFFKLYFVLIFPNPMYMLIVVVGNSIYGLMILREKIRSIEKTFGNKEMWYEDKAYQKFVEILLIRCIQEHITIKRNHELSMQILRRNFFIVFLVAVLLLGCFYINISMNMSHEALMKSSSIIMLCFIISYLFTRMGQRLEDEVSERCTDPPWGRPRRSEELFRDLCNCPWILWNKSNKLIYQMLLMHSREPLSIQSLGLALDNSLLVRLAKTSMSFLTVLQKLTS